MVDSSNKNLYFSAHLAKIMLMRSILLATLLFVLVLSQSHSDDGHGVQQNFTQEQTSALYVWPRDSSSSKKESYSDRNQKVATQMILYSSRSKILSSSDEKRAQKLVAQRQSRLVQINSKGSSKSFCAAVKRALVDKPYDDGLQYGKCGEGAMIGACLALQYGFSEKEILLCSSDRDHQWAMIPESPGSKSYCLLDRLNAPLKKPLCEISIINGKDDPTTGGFNASSIKFSGKIHKDSSFSGVKCSNLINHVLTQKYYWGSEKSNAF